MKTPLYFTLVTSVALLAGCATVAPNELVNARSAYQYASEGPAQQLAPAELHKAHEALSLAERSFQNEPDSYRTKDLAYVAQRKSEQAGALGSMAAATASKDRSNAAFQQKQSEIVQQGKQDLSDSERRTAEARAEIDRQAAIAQGKRDLNESERRAAETRAELEKQAAVKAAKDKADADLQQQQAVILQGEQNLRESEKRTAAALASLSSLASLKEEERGLVLTLSGSVLFRSAESTLLAPARVKLDQVAKALLAIPARNLIVEGHTDSQGSNAYNQALSQRRADAVRNYLVGRGYPAGSIQALGQGETSPIAKNVSAEGRANNRRVEIVIQREKK